MPEPSTDTLLRYALGHHQAGRLAEAETLYRQILAADPNHPDALHLLGVLAMTLKHNDRAVALMRQAIALQPRNPIYRNNLGNALRQQGALDKAIACYQQALTLRHDDAETLTNLGVAWKEKGLLDDAIACYRRALALKPDHAEACNNLGNALTAKGQLHEALTSFAQALALKPDDANAHFNLGIALRNMGRHDEAIACYQQALALKPDFTDAWYNKGNALQDTGRRAEAIACFRQAVALRPDFAEAHYNLALAWLLLGNFLDAWPHYEWRWKCRDFHAPSRDLPRPQWDGGPLAGRTIHVHAEQGLGDSIHFVRYVALLAERGGRINLECQPQLKRLFGNIAGVGQVVTTGELLPDFDVHCPLQTLPLRFGTTLQNIPRQVPYLHADGAEIALWGRRIQNTQRRLLVGLAWAGNMLNMNDRNRSVTLATLAPLGTVEGVRFVSLQKGPPAAQARTPPVGMELIDWTDELGDFAATAALIANLDLVIAVDTAVAHLAGAMGKPVWVLLPFAPDWRWQLKRDDSPWYPTMRLFRQIRTGDWDDVARRAGDALAEFSRSGARANGNSPFIQ